MEKRGRGRPRKVQPPDLDQSMPKLHNKKVTPELFKIYIPELASQVMRIPPDFIDKLGGNVPASFTLKRPRRETSWQVDTSKIDDDWYFVKGWPQFVEENSLKDGDFMTLELVGDSLFCATIFSPNGCLKDVAVDYRISSDDEKSSESEDSESEINGIDQRIVSSKRNRSVGSVNGNPYFSVMIVKSNIDSGYMTIPKSFWDLYMRKKVKEGSSMVALWVKDDAWTVNLKVEADRVKLAGGYPKFIKDNSVKVGTTCTFQLIDSNPFSYKVTFSK